MIIPRFELSQDNEFITIKIRAPYCDLNEYEIEIDKDVFLFYCKPFHLRLHLPRNIIESDKNNAKFLTDSQEFIFKVLKENKDEFFEDLDMITNLLTPSTNEKLKGKAEIEVIASEIENLQLTDNEQEIPVQENVQSTELFTNISYGFGNQKTDYLDTVQYDLDAILDDVKIFKIRVEDRDALRLKSENFNFNISHYLYDLFETEYIEELINFESQWDVMLKNKKQVKFTNEEIDIMKDLPTREYLLNKSEQNSINLGLIDILYAFCFEKRSFLFENSVESSWAINKISSTLSCFTTFHKMEDVIISCFRRSLIFPLYRNFQLSQKVLQDLLTLLKLGKVFIIQCLLEIYTLCNSQDSSAPRFILNELYIKDYCIYVQKLKSSDIQQLIETVENIKITKTDLDLNLIKIENQAKRVISGQNKRDDTSDGESSESDTSSDSDASTDSDTSSTSDTSSDRTDSDSSEEGQPNAKKLNFVQKIEDISIEENKIKITLCYAQIESVKKENMDELIHLKSPWSENPEKFKMLTKEEQDILNTLPQKEYMLDKKNINAVYLGLFDVLYAYCFGKRIHFFGNTPELCSAICGITSSLSWLEEFQDLTDVIASCLTHSIEFPVYGSFELSYKTFRDLKLLLKLGKNAVLKCLLETYLLYKNNSTDGQSRFILNVQFIQDYCIFTNKSDISEIESLERQFAKIEIHRTILRKPAQSAVHKENKTSVVKNDDENERILKQFGKITIEENENDSDDDD